MAAASVSLKSNSSEKIATYFCSRCKDTNTETEAKAYCKNCDSCFCDECTNLHSQFFQNHTTYGPKEMEYWPVAMATQDFLQKCGVHKGKNLTLFCGVHSQLCCDTCVLLSHRQCQKVTLIANTTVSGSELQQMSAKIDTILGALTKLQSHWESNIKSLLVSYEKRLEELKSMREKINCAYNKLESATREEMDEVKACSEASLNFDVDTCSGLYTELKRLSHAIHEIGRKSNELAFIARQKGVEMITQVDKYLENNSIQQTEVSLKLIVYNDIVGYLSNLSGLGHTIHIAKALTMHGDSDQAIIVTGATPVSVKIPSDTFISYDIEGICGLFDGQILVADTHNKRLKLLDMQQKVVSSCDMSGNLKDMCQITPYQVAVAVDNDIQFVSVYKKKLVKGRRLELPHECRGVANHEDDLYVTVGTALYKYNLTGKLVKKMYEETSITRTCCRCAVSPRGDRIYVTNYDHHKLITLARDGTVISTFTDEDLQGPWRVHVTPAGQVLVCGNLSNTVIQVDAEGKKKIATVATLKDGMSLPRSVFYSKKYRTVIVGQSNENIMVFNLK